MRRQPNPQTHYPVTGWLRRFEVREDVNGLAIASNTTGNVVEIAWDEVEAAELLCGVLLLLAAESWIDPGVLCEVAFRASKRFGYAFKLPTVEVTHGS